MVSSTQKIRLLLIILIGFVISAIILASLFLCRKNSILKKNSIKNVSNKTNTEISNNTPDLILTGYNESGSFDSINYAKLDKNKVKIISSCKLNSNDGLPLLFYRINPDNTIEHLKKVKKKDCYLVYLTKKNYQTGKEISSHLLLKHDNTLKFNHILISQDGKKLIIQDVMMFDIGTINESDYCSEGMSRVYILDISELKKENCIFTLSKAKAEKETSNPKYKLIKPEIAMPQIWNPRISNDGDFLAFLGSSTFFTVMIPDLHKIAVTDLSLFVKDIRHNRIVDMGKVGSDNLFINWSTDCNNLIWTTSRKNQYFHQEQRKNVFISHTNSDKDMKTEKHTEISYDFSVCFKNDDLILVDKYGIYLFNLEGDNFQEPKKFYFDKPLHYIGISDISSNNDRLLFTGEEDYNLNLFIYDFKKQQLSKFVIPEKCKYKINWYHTDQPNTIMDYMIHPMDILKYPRKS